MGRRYYCEYCDKSFPDNPTNRRNHLNAIQHRAQKKQHYDFFQGRKKTEEIKCCSAKKQKLHARHLVLSYHDPEVTLVEDSMKRPCRIFLQEESCKFGNACIYSHLTDENREQLKALVAKKHASRRPAHKSTTDQSEVSTPEDQLSDWFKKRKKAGSSSVNQSISEDSKCLDSVKRTKFSLPDCLQDVDNLPVSLIPPDEQAMEQTIAVEWG